MTKASLLYCEFGIFFSQPIESTYKLIKEIPEHYKVFDRDPVNIPVPEEAINLFGTALESSNNIWRIEASRTRINIVFTPPYSEKKKYEDIENELKKIKEILTNLIEEAQKQNVQISRITNISRLITIIKDPVNYLEKKFFKSESQNRSDLTLRFNDPINEKNLPCNNITLHETAKKEDTGEIGILTLRDFNTDDTKKKLLTIEDINNFWEITKKYSHMSGLE